MRSRQAWPFSCVTHVLKGIMTRYQRAAVHDFSIFYRQAGPKEAPAIVLVHGFPTLSHIFRNFIPLLADRFDLVAPDLSGFGFTDAPGRDRFRPTFENLTKSINGFTEAFHLNRYAMLYVLDYGAPVGFPGVIRLTSMQDCLERTAPTGGFWCSTTPS